MSRSSGVLLSASSAPLDASFVTLNSEGGLTGETLFRTLIPAADVVANRPAAGIVGRLYNASDTSTLYRDNGASWDVWFTHVDLTTAQTLTNKRITKRVETLTDAATVTPNADSADGGSVAELSQDALIANPTGTPTQGQQYVLRITTTSVRVLTYGNKFRGSTNLTLPSHTTGSATDYLGFTYDVDTDTWDLLAKSTGY